MNFGRGDETVSARDDYDELACLERGAGVTCIEDAETQAKVALNEIDRLRAAAKHGELMARAVIELVDEKAALEAEVARFRAHSVLLNKVAWQLHEAMGVIPEGTESFEGDIEADLPDICRRIRQAP